MRTIEELSQMMTDLVRAKGWFDEDTKRKQTPRNMACSLSIEAAEVLEHFQWTDEILHKDELASELGDVFLYLMQLAKISEIDLEDAVLRKIEVNYGRTWEE